MTNLLHFTLIFENPTVSLSALYKSCTKFACCSSEIFRFLCAGSSFQNANEQFVSCIHLSFVNFAPDPTLQTNGAWFGYSNSSVSITFQN